MKCLEILQMLFNIVFLVSRFYYLQKPHRVKSPIKQYEMVIIIWLMIIL